MKINTLLCSNAIQQMSNNDLKIIKNDIKWIKYKIKTEIKVRKYALIGNLTDISNSRITYTK